jgi:hypothetical protein
MHIHKIHIITLVIFSLTFTIFNCENEDVITIRINGIVTDTENYLPISEAIVELGHARFEDLESPFGYFEPLQQVITDEEGTYLLTYEDKDQICGFFEITISKNGYFSRRYSRHGLYYKLTLNCTEELQVFDFQLEQIPMNVEIKVKGVVTDALNGIPVDSALVILNPVPDYYPYTPLISVLTDNQGLYQLKYFVAGECHPNSFEISAKKRGYRSSGHRYLDCINELQIIDFQIEPEEGE